MPDSPHSKAALREILRQQRRHLDPAAQRTAAEAVAVNVARLPGWSDATRIALYLPNDGEIGTAPLAELCRESGKQLFLPVIDASLKLLQFARWQEHSELVTNRFGIPEPGTQARSCSAWALDIVILPMVAWDRRGGRLGMGGGFYDRALAGTGNTLRVGIAHTLQEVAEVPCDDWDIALDFAVTDSAVHCCQR